MRQPEFESNRLNRRELVTAAAAAGLAAAVPALGAQDAVEASAAQGARKGRIQQSVCRWCYSRIELDTLAAEGKKMGLVGIDLLGPKEFETVKKHGLVCTMTNSHPIHPGLNKKKNHEKALAMIRDAIEATSAAGFKNVICFSGNR